MELSSEFWNGFYSGVIATLIGFVLTMLWDVWKTWRTDRKHDKAVLRALQYECEENAAVAQQNVNLFEQELHALAESKFLIVTTIPFKSGLWDVLRPSIPTKVLAHVDLLSLLRDISSLVAHLNEGFRSRQTYKDTSGAMSNFTDRLKLLDEHLHGQVKELQELLSRATQELKAVSRTSWRRMCDNR